MDSYEQILSRMLSKVPEQVDKREGSLTYNAVAPTAAEVQNMIIALSSILDQTFADTADRENLIKRARERGLKPEPESPTHGMFKGEFNVEIPIGNRFSLGNYNYTAIEKISIGAYKLQCEQAGAEPNGVFGDLIPVEYVDGLTAAKLTELLIPGEEVEDTETFRQRFLNNFDAQAFGGNKTDYKRKVNALSGVGGVKVIRAPSGGGAVGIIVINSEYKKPSAELVNFVQSAIDPEQNQGEGDGLAPIYHFVTVEGVSETAVNITMDIEYQEGWEWNDIQSAAENMIDRYFIELNKTWEDSKNLIVRISQIETRMLDIAGVVDISGTTLNGTTENLVIAENSIPAGGEVVG